MSGWRKVNDISLTKQSLWEKQKIFTSKNKKSQNKLYGDIFPHSLHRSRVRLLLVKRRPLSFFTFPGHPPPFRLQPPLFLIDFLYFYLFFCFFESQERASEREGELLVCQQSTACPARGVSLEMGYLLATLALCISDHWGSISGLSIWRSDFKSCCHRNDPSFQQPC